MSGRRASEIAAAGFAHPAAILVGEIVGPARVDRWGGEAESPDWLTVHYGAEEIGVTSYPIRWSEDPSAVHVDGEVVDWWVESAYASAWWARQPEAFSNGRSENVQRKWRLLREEAARNAAHRIVPLSLGGSQVDATVVGDSETWSAGFEMPPDSMPLSVLLNGGSVPVDSLKLELVDELLAHLDRT